MSCIYLSLDYILKAYSRNSIYLPTGIDLVPGRKGETWLGLSKTGRFAVLLNVQEDLKRKMRGRGMLHVGPSQ